jgi:DNA repair protein SbcD/Mre11
MSKQSFRFLHAGDFHLEQTLSGVAEVPEHLSKVFLESRYNAARRVFDAALFEEAAFVILAGDILHPMRTGPRGPIFLREQFARLAEREIAVYWAGGTVDPPESWPVPLALPGNVHVFPRGRVDEYICEIDGAPAARLLGTSRDKQLTIRAGDFHPDSNGLLTIAAAYGVADPSALQSRGINYWALGGRHERVTLTSTPPLMHYCGTPQGNRPEESGIHGCTLVQVDENRQFQTSLIPTDDVRWLNERIVVDKRTSQDNLTTLLTERLHSLRQSAAESHLFITWTISGSGPLINQLQQGRLAIDLLGRLRNDYGFADPVAWSLSIEVEPSDCLPAEWYEQETIRGDYLRDIRRLQISPDEPLGLENYISETHQIGALGAFANFADKNDRDKVLIEAALLGASLLSGNTDKTQEPQP